MARPGVDPGLAFRFKVELDGLLIADFAEVSGLEAENEVQVIREGGVNEYEHHFLTIRKYPPPRFKTRVYQQSGALELV